MITFYRESFRRDQLPGRNPNLRIGFRLAGTTTLLNDFIRAEAGRIQPIGCDDVVLINSP